ncbi:Hint domain-containing protein [Gluconobacter cerinus]|nr:Hint domain-containing protein [Gluconobacter cerinus]MBS0984464.1 Hint domain-containing protein [Gluconobacter cerinus]MBS1023485.1 Hint domain-containing protein [Gluconobacter cerinus]
MTVISGYTVSSGSTYTISSGSVADDTTILNGGTGIINRGGTSIAATVLSGGTLFASSGGLAQVGGTGINTTVESGGSAIFDYNALEVVSSGTDYGVTLQNGAYMAVSSGGTAISYDVKTSAWVGIVGGGTSLSGTLAGGTESVGRIYTGGNSSPVASGSGVSIDDTFTSGIQNIYTGGTAIDSVISTGGTQVVSSGGSSLSATVLSGGTGLVSSGGTSIAETVSNGGSEIIASGGVASSAIISSGGKNYVSSSGISIAETISNGGSEIITSRGVASNTIVESGGKDYVSSGGTSIAATVLSGGTLFASSGGRVQVGGTGINTTVESGGSAIFDYNALEVVSSGTDYGVTLQNGAYMAVSSGGTAISYNVKTSAWVGIVGGGTSLSGTLAGGTESVGRIYTGGTSSPVASGSGVSIDDTFTSGIQNIYTGGTAIDSVISIGGTQVVSSGGSSLSATVLSGGTGLVSSGGTSIAETVSNGGSEIISSGGVATSTVIASGGQDYVSSGGTSISATVLSGGKLFVSSGGQSQVGGTGINTTVESGGSAIFDYNALELVSSGTDSGVFLQNGAYMAVSSGGTAISYDAVGSSGSVANSDWIGIAGGGTSLSGTLYGSTESVGRIYLSGNHNTPVASGSGVSLDDTLTSSLQNIYIGGTAVDSFISAGGTQVVSSGGSSLSATVLSGGTGLVSSGGSSIAETVSNGGVEIVSSGGVTNQTILMGGGSEVVSSAGWSFDAVISSGGTAVLNTSTGLVSATLLDRGSIDFNYLGGTIISATVTSSGQLSAYSTNGSSTTIQLAGAYPSTENTFTLSGDTVTLICFLAGTMIRTPGGEVAVEDLRIGDSVMTYDWSQDREVVRPLTWVGRQKSTLRPDQPDDLAGYPVRVLKNAIADGVPHKDLLVTPEHCLFFEQKFVPARMLINGTSIFYDRSLTSYEFFHIETEEHSVIWSDGMLSESYLDTGNRKNFTQHGQLATLQGKKKTWDTDAGASLTTDRETVEPLFRRLETRSAELGLAAVAELVSLTQDPDLHLVTDKGLTIRAMRKANSHSLFMIPSGVKEVRLMSRTSRPSDVIGPFVDDRRTLGVLVGKISIFASSTTTSITEHLVNEDLNGWSARETGACRWTEGNALLALKQQPGNDIYLLSVEILEGGPYLLDTVDAKNSANVG